MATDYPHIGRDWAAQAHTNQYLKHEADRDVMERQLELDKLIVENTYDNLWSDADFLLYNEFYDFGEFVYTTDFTYDGCSYTYSGLEAFSEMEAENETLRLENDALKEDNAQLTKTVYALMKKLSKLDVASDETDEVKPFDINKIKWTP
tara:strand:- start:1234 stop:1680 length:447 start_codon:yes stop_codon:yes gene_type:complete